VIQRIPITDREQWLGLRKHDITASTVGALFNLHPYSTVYELFLEKTEYDPPNIDSKAMRRGRLLEPVVAAAVADEHPEWTITKATEYLRDPAIRLGCTPDFYVEGDPRGFGIIQAKTAGPFAFKRSWSEDGMPPMWIALQAATEMMLTGAQWGAVAVLVNDDDLALHWYDIPRNAGVEARIRDAVENFWIDVDFKNKPQPDFARDADLIAALTRKVTRLKSIDLSGDNYLPVILAERATLKKRAADDAKRLKEIDAEIKFKMGDAEIGVIDGFAITFKEQTNKAYSVAEKTFRTLRVTDHREKDTDEHAGSF
jgi:predicted phage-related endonuclease